MTPANYRFSALVLSTLMIGPAGNTLAGTAGDFDGDGDVDLVDFGEFQICFSGPGVSAGDECARGDFDGDGDVDLADFGGFQLAFSGPAELCDAEWSSQFCPVALNGSVHAMTTWDDGTGEALYVGGEFTIAGCTLAANIAKWDGEKWTALGSGIHGETNPAVYALTIMQDASAPAGSVLVVGGEFTTADGQAAANIAIWDGLAWSPVGSGVNDVVRSLAVYDEGDGESLFVGGEFTSAGVMPIANIARWDGADWSSVGGGMSGGMGAPYVMTLGTYDDGSGLSLYAGGFFTEAGGIPANRIARWDGRSWSALGEGVDGSFPIVNAMAVYDDPAAVGGQSLFVGGGFTEAGGTPASRIARWNGTSWSPVAGGIDGSPTPIVSALTVVDSDTGSILYAGGRFSSADDVAVQHVAQWDGKTWQPLPGGPDDEVFALTAFNNPSTPEGEALYAGGPFETLDGLLINRIATWDGASWSKIGVGPFVSGGGQFLVVDDGTITGLPDGEEVLFASNITSIGADVDFSGVGFWDGELWQPVGQSPSGLTDMVVFDDGAGPKLHAINNGPGGHLFIYDGSEWSEMTFSITGGTQRVLSLAVFDDGTGQELYIGGDFVFVQGVSANSIAKWDGLSWSGLLSGLSFGDSVVETMYVFDDGNGEALYVGGSFERAGSLVANNIARWNGFTWSVLGSGLGDKSLFGNEWVYDLATFDDGTGPALYAGGSFMVSGFDSVEGVAKWTGATWVQVGTPSISDVRTLAVLDDPDAPGGQRLIAGGLFSEAGGTTLNRIARLGGATWAPLGMGVNGFVFNAIGFDEGDAFPNSGDSLFISGIFTIASGTPSAGIAKWHHPAAPCDE
jgi:hypothetical protein